MVKLYLRYQQEAAFGVVASGASNSLFAHDPRHAIAPALEEVRVWDVKKGSLIATWRDGDNKAEVTCLARSPDGIHVAVGYSDGSIRIWSTESNSSSITFNGHRSAVTALSYDALGSRLASGSRDTDLIVWSILSESGLFRLKGHKDQITSLRFLAAEGMDHIASCSKDSLIRIWDLGTRACIETVVAHRGEVWSLDVVPGDRVMLSGGADGELRVWEIRPEVIVAAVEAVHGEGEIAVRGGSADPALNVKRGVVLKGTLERQGKDKISDIAVHSGGKFIGVLGSERLLEIFRIRTDDEVRKRLARRKKRLREKATTPAGSEAADATEEVVATVSDEIPRHTSLRCSARIRSFDFAPAAARPTKDAGIQILCALANNSMEVHVCDAEKEKDKEGAAEPASTRMVCEIEMPGHRSDIRTLALSSNEEMLVSGSSDSVKVWSMRTRVCLKTMESGYALCCAFLPGDTHLVVGCKTGDMQLFDLARSSLIETIKAHDGPIWSLVVRPDRKGITTGSQDKDVKFWDLGLIEDLEYSKNQKRPTLIHTRTLRMSDDVLCVRHSPDSRLLAVSLLDSTVKILHADTLKFFLSLYGHKLPVLSMDISSDGTLIATASSDRSVKIWGLDFGDCHRSLHAHADSVMGVQFVWGTHFMFSVGKDKVIKYWDADKFEQIMKLDGHHGEIWALAVGKYGSTVVTGSHDRSIRIWEKTDEQFVLEEERDRELEEKYEETAAAAGDGRIDPAIGSGVTDAELAVPPPTGAEDEIADAGKRTVETLKAGERIAEAIDVYEEERTAFDLYEKLKLKTPDLAPPSRHPFVQAINKPNITPEGYVLHVAERVRSSDLEEALLVLPFTKVIGLMKCISFWVDKGWNQPLTARILLFLLRTHHAQLASTRALAPTIARLRSHLRAGLRAHRDRIGFNVAGLRVLSAEAVARAGGGVFGDVPEEVPVPVEEGPKGGKGDKGKKRKRKVVVKSG
ncbi:quinon protein alcohol dehydrogenase-like superfamily [Blyttiomyces helicus]|uniref:Quinon protein alcohol dehydrogenase-like superfamily n=1 Tax=Blyttiomyces helicus TaxID=388810 RepID=A0A4P9WH31_9FUNG|nr:quinon protein alcohol dehydrogenase-like superfamily [Blyttiomyces helicus]|eukprot:RKO90360.1 quinon protein alcohol dehydrogenase-like superfamily [Blyttiomyces helicus]